MISVLSSKQDELTSTLKILKLRDDRGSPFYRPNAPIIHSASALVDGKMWHTIRVTQQVSQYIDAQPSSYYDELSPRFEFRRRIFDVSDELYILLMLKFAQ